MIRNRLQEASPFEVVLLTVSAVAATVVTVGTDIPPSLAATLPPWAQMSWSIGLGVGSIMALIGLVLPQPVDARLLELSGLMLVTATTLTYAVALYVVQGDIAIITASLSTAYGVACAWRAWQLWRAVRAVVRDVKER